METKNEETKKPEEEEVADKVTEDSSEDMSPLDRAEKINKEKKELLELEKANLDRREKILAEEKVSGRARIGTPQTPEEIAKAASDERIKAIGKAGGAAWAKD